MIDIINYILPALFILIAGGFEGVMDGLQFHYDKYNQFWNPDISWVNKYKVKSDPSQGKTFRGKYLVFTTDGWHLMKWCRNLFVMCAIVFSFGIHAEWWVYVLEILMYWGVNRVGFNLTYSRF